MFFFGTPEYQLEFRKPILSNQRIIRKKLKEIIEPQGNEFVLDLGCGVGILGKILSPFYPNGKILGIDLDPELVDYGNAHFGKRKNLHLELGNALAIDYPANTFDIITAFGLFEYIKDIDQVLSEALRVLKRPGKVISILDYWKMMGDSPRPDIYKQFLLDLERGMNKAGVDLDMDKFLATCEKLNLKVDIFTFKIEPPPRKITKEMVRLMEVNMNEFKEKTQILEQVVAFNYQFLKLAGWSETEVRNLFFNDLTFANLLDFYKENIGEIYVVKRIYKIFRILV